MNFSHERSIYFIIFGIFAVLTMGCEQYSPQDESQVNFASEGPQCKRLGRIGAKAIYDADDRLDWWQVNGAQKNYWAASTVALVARNRLIKNGTSFDLSGPSYGAAKDLCSDVPFFEQPQVAFCSGFLVSKNTVVTAGHCVYDQFDCANTAFVFDFAKRQSDQEVYTARDRDVYSCGRILARDDFADYAVIELSRDVVDRTPLNIRREGQPSPDDELVLIGHPSGLPSKIAGGGRIFSVSGETILASVDAFAGNSGAVVMNKTSGLVEGILVAGEPDFIYDEERQCQREYVCEGELCIGEVITPISALKAQIPDVAYTPPELSCP